MTSPSRQDSTDGKPQATSSARPQIAQVPAKRRKGTGKLGRGLVSLGAAAVIAVYAAGYVLFLALIMLDDPPTSPAKHRGRVTLGLIAASASYAIFMTLGAVYFLPAGALVANAWETVRRLRS